MKNFTATPAGLTSQLSSEEAQLLAVAADEVAILLDAPIIDPMLIAALTDETPTPPDHTDPSLANLLSPLASDPELDSEMQSLCSEELRRDKARRLSTIAQLLRAAANTDGTVIIHPGEEWMWLCALTDLRQALAGTLQADSLDDVAEIEQYASRVAKATDPTDLITDQPRNPLVATIFTLIGAWQESLLTVMNTSASHR